ncbi:MAG: VOC family protein [Chthoniobacteraceae bacterium]|nr:VOC family protein [Chthoniobacteraceae bacterium]
MKTQFEDVAFVVYPVSDMARARAFYADVLELQETSNWENIWVEYDIGHGTLAITNSFPERQPGAKGALLGIEVKDLDAVAALLAKKGIAWSSGPFDTPVCRGASIKDPEGNELILHQRKNKNA